jgi:hypothetical protein
MNTGDTTMTNLTLHAGAPRRAALACAALLASAFTTATQAASPDGLDDATASAASAATRPCSAGDLHVTVGAAGAWRGFASQEIRLARIGTGRCWLDGAPALELVSAEGLRQAVAAGDEALTRRRVDLDPGDAMQVLLGTPGTCDAAIGPERRVLTRLRLVAPGGGDAVLAGVHVDTLCGAPRVLHAARLDTDARPAAQGAARAPWRDLDASLAEVSPASAGGPLHYVVTLANPGASAVTLPSCAAYRLSMHVEGRTVETAGRLGCDATPATVPAQVPAHGQAAFALETTVPAAMAGPGLKLSWTLQGGPSAGRIVPLQ